VDDHVRQVEQDPLAAIVALDVVRLLAGSVQALDDRVGDGLGLAALGAGADDEAVGEGGDFPQVEGDGVLRLLVGGGLEDEGDLLFQLNVRSSPVS
jgi:hypothetical protein